MADAGDALDDNPDFNQAAGPAGNGADWRIATFGQSYPTVGPPAHINCNEASFDPGELTDNPGPWRCST